MLPCQLLAVCAGASCLAPLGFSSLPLTAQRGQERAPRWHITDMVLTHVNIQEASGRIMLPALGPLVWPSLPVSDGLLSVPSKFSLDITSPRECP